MDDTLNRLLEAESRAERLVEEALEENERATGDALSKVAATRVTANRSETT